MLKQTSTVYYFNSEKIIPCQILYAAERSYLKPKWEPKTQVKGQKKRKKKERLPWSEQMKRA